MPDREPSHSDDGSRVIGFRRRQPVVNSRAPSSPPVDDLTKYARGENPDDYRHRMIMNGLAFAATIVLIVAGIWIADVMAHMRKDQDCVLTGRRACAPIQAPLQSR